MDSGRRLRLSCTATVVFLAAALACGPAVAQRDEDPRPQATDSQGPSGPEALRLPFREFAQAKGVDPGRLADALGLPPESDLSSPVSELLRSNDLGPQDVQRAMHEVNPLAAEAAMKDWGKIRLKFALWGVMFLLAMVLLMTVPIRKPLRSGCLLIGAIVFGVWLGVEPNAPGTVKDGLLLYGESRVISLPRLLAFVGFVLMSIIGNKVFCGWGCQFGTLQDLAWQLPVKKVKPPFWLTNAARVAFFTAVAGTGLTVAFDIMEPIDPFRIFRFGATAAVVVAVVVLVAGVWVYRPWCTFLCPFGLVSWVGERVSLFRPRVNHTTCIDCRACERACPTHSMKGLRAKRLLAQDCFACGACIRTCPVNAIRWHVTPPPDPAGDVDG